MYREPPPEPEQGAIDPEDPELLRVDGEWHPQHILEKLGAAPHDGEHLPRLLIACAVVQGAARVQEMAGRIETLSAQQRPRIETLSKEPPLLARKQTLAELATTLVSVRKNMGGVKARAANDALRPGPYGLKVGDLAHLLTGVKSVVLAGELASKPNLAGIERMLVVLGRQPEISLVNFWRERLLPAAPLAGIQIYRPDELCRVVIVHDDGRLAYDPGGLGLY